MTAITLKLPARYATVRPGPLGGVEVLIDHLTLSSLADALNAMEHNDTDPGERRMNADQCRDALLREVLHSWTTRELIGARIPGVLELADLLHECRETLSKFRPVEFLLKSGPLDTEAAFAQCVEKIREQSAQLAGAAAMQDMMTREAFEFKAQVAALTRERNEARAHLIATRDLIWSKDIPSPATPEYREWHENCQRFMGFIEQFTHRDTTPTPGAQP